MYRNAPIPLIIRFVYLFLRTLTWIGVTIFYRRRIVLGREHLRIDGPAIIVVNHPSTLMDPLNTCLSIHQEPFFLANYSMFKHPVSKWIFTRLLCIPVKRREDVGEGETRNNDTAFKKSFQHLEKNGLLFIAAEGVSWMERWVKPFKPGAARIALGAESRQDWNLGVKILPVGLSYSAANLFRSEVIVNFGAPIDVAPWATANQENHDKAIKDFSVEIEDQVRSLVLDTRDAAGQGFMEQLEAIHSGKFPAGGPEYFAFRKSLIDNNIDNEQLRLNTASYFETLENAGVSEKGLAIAANKTASVSIIQTVFLLVAGFPAFLLGYGFWFLPCYLPWLLVKKMKLYIGYDSTVKVLSGLFTFSLAMWGAYKAATFFLGSSAWGLLVLAGLILSGYIAARYLDVLQLWREKTAAFRLKNKDATRFLSLLKKREEIVEMTVYSAPSK